MNHKVDVYSFGLILWELLSGKRAFQEHLKHNDLAVFTNAICVKGERPPIPPENTKDEGWNNKFVTNLIQKCWSDKAKDRPDFQEIYDELNVLITEGYIKDDWGRNFWLINFPDQDFVPWDDFIKVLMCKKTVQLDDGTTFTKGLSLSIKTNPENKKKSECFRLLLAQISGQARSVFNRVYCENFGKVLAWFGPGVDNDPKAVHKNFLERMAYICRQPWFFGLPENPERLLHDGPKPVYMIRLSNDPGYFTIHTTKMKTRILYTPGTGYRPEKEKEVCSDLVEFVNSKLKAYEIQIGSDYYPIFGALEPQQQQGNAYQAITNLNLNPAPLADELKKVQLDYKKKF